MAEESATTPVVIPTIQEDVTPESTEDALRIVMRKSLEANGLVRGLSEVARALDRRSAHLCILAADCEDAGYKKLIQALCKVNNIDIVMVEERAKLAEWAGLVKRDAEGNVKKHFKCSSVCIRDFGERTKALEMLLAQLQ
eukprot:TRINITY_DN382_c0_g1_i22.p2 TRINITY_DN382_c0_g1~~TRINITY_DN382_c0_g1_i22.p2  ORF type:complete len:140 (-),score=52.17 TRINITY_DN382_c0_g1_i22:252-671(-)